ncbi:MAG: SDR family oxidoreductase [Pseudomonadales bacterium]
MVAQLGRWLTAASKGAADAFTRNASIDLGRFGVRVNAVAPEPVDGGMLTRSISRIHRV